MKFGIWIHAAQGQERIAAAIRAKEIGFDGLGLMEPVGDSPAEFGAIAPVVCVGGEGILDAQSLERGLAVAKGAGAKLLRVKVGRPGRRPTAGSLNAIANSLILMADVAAAMGITLAVVNSPELPLVRDLWTVMDRCQHPAVRCCWDASAAAAVGQGPSIGVPVLNSFIALVQVRVRADGTGFEQGDAAVEELIHRLRGVGFGGHLLLDGVTTLELVSKTADVLGKLRQWSAPPATKHKASHAPPGKAPVAGTAAPLERRKTPASSAGA